jgi:hypothetical protein
MKRKAIPRWELETEENNVRKKREIAGNLKNLHFDFLDLEAL